MRRLVIGLVVLVLSFANAQSSVQPAAAAVTCSVGWNSEVKPPPKIRVLRTATNKVDTVDFFTYVTNVLPNEWIASWPAASLEAGALASKTYAWYWTLHRKSSKYVTTSGQCYDVKDTTADQVYKPGTAHAATTAAVRATWGTSLAKNGALPQTQYCDNVICNTAKTKGGDKCGANVNGTRLSQWGSRDCAIQGKSAAQILRIYYTGIQIYSNAPPLSQESASGFGDATGNGTGDVLAIDPKRSDGTLLVYPSNGKGKWSSTVPLVRQSGLNGFNAVLRGDFTGDGIADLLLRDQASSSLSLMTGLSKGRWKAPVRIAAGREWGDYRRFVSPGDVTGDGLADVLAITLNGDLVLRARTKSGWAAPKRLIGGFNRFAQVTAVGDITGDRRPDIVALDKKTGELLRYRFTGIASSPFRYDGLAGKGYRTTAKLTGLGRFTGTSVPDIGRYYAGASTLFVSAGRPKGTFAPAGSLPGSWGQLAGLF